MTEGVEKITDQYKNTCFIEANVNTELKEREGGVADVIVHVAEGDQYRVGRIEFHGNLRTHDKVLRRELRVQEGMLLNIAGVKNSVFKVEQLQYFKPDKNDPVEFANVDSDKKTVDLVFKGDEADRTELQIGCGWSQPDGFFGQVSVRAQNFLGRGEALGLSVQAGGIRDIYDCVVLRALAARSSPVGGIQLFQLATTTPEHDHDQQPGSDFEEPRRDGSATGAPLVCSTTSPRLHLFEAAHPSDRDHRDGFVLPPSKLLPNIPGARRTPATAATTCRRSSPRTLRQHGQPPGADPGHALRRLGDFAGGPLGGTKYYYRPEVDSRFHGDRLPGEERPGIEFLRRQNPTAQSQGLTYYDYYYLGGENNGLRGMDPIRRRRDRPHGKRLLDTNTGSSWVEGQALRQPRVSLAAGWPLPLGAVQRRRRRLRLRRIGNRVQRLDTR